MNLKEQWLLDPNIRYLNHGSFGAAPRAVLDQQMRWRDRLERDPLHFFDREYLKAMAAAREALGAFVGAEPDDLAFLPNATTGVNTVLRSFPIAAGDDILVTNHGYNACTNAARVVAEQRGGRVVVAELPFPITSPEQAIDAILRVVTPKTRLALVDHVTSPTALVLPVAEIAKQLEARGVSVLIDGAHAPGMLPLDIRTIGATYYTANCHKWMCAPKGAGFLWVRRDRQEQVRPLVISNGASLPGSRFRNEFEWTGTADPSAFLSVPKAIATVDALVEGGWPEVMYRNRALALASRARLAAELGVEPPCPDEMVGSMATLPLPPAPPSTAELDPLAEALYAQHAIEVPVFRFPRGSDRRWFRISAQLYNQASDYESLGQALLTLVPRRATPEHQDANR